MTIYGFIAGFAGGIFGAAIGALPAFIFLGFFILIGVAIQAGGGTVPFLGEIPFGALFGPHVGGFAAGVAAAAYAAKKGKLGTGRDIATAVMSLNSPDALLIGGLFGILGYVINWAFTLIGTGWTDTIALTVVTSAIIARLLWGNGVFGKVKEGIKRYAPDDATKWLAYQNSWPQLLIIGLGAGLMSAYFTIVIGPENGGVFIGFAFSAISLIMLQFGVGVPVTHHITLVAAVAAATTGSFIWGGAFGILAAFLGEFFANTFLVHGDTHIDPPACTIATSTSIILALNALGVFAALTLF